MTWGTNTVIYIETRDCDQKRQKRDKTRPNTEPDNDKQTMQQGNESNTQAGKEPEMTLVGDIDQGMQSGGGKQGEGNNNIIKNQEDNTNRNQRRKRRRTRKNKEISIAVMNVRGIKGKIKSLEAIVQTQKTKIALITETHLKNNETINIKGYKWLGRNRTKQNGGGVGILINNELAGSTTQSDEVEGSTNTETLWIEVKTRPKPLHIGVFYGPQEGNPKENTETIYTALETQVNQLKQTGEVIIAGDFNAKLKHEDINQDETRNGKLLQKMITNQELTVLNMKPDHGIWTRVNRKNQLERSVIDYIITTESCKKYVTNIIVDEEGALRPKGKNESDHNTITAKIKVNQAKRPKFVKKWNLRNQEGWKKFNQTIEKELEEAGWKNQPTTQERYNTFEETMKETLRKTVGESKIRTDKPPKDKSEARKKLKEERKRTKLFFENTCKNGTPEEKKVAATNYMRAQRELKEKIEEEEKHKLEAKLKEIYIEARKNPNIIWDLKKKAKPNNELEYETIDEDGNKIMDPDKTKEHIAGYFENLYQARPGTPEYQSWTDEIEETIKEIIEEYRNNRTNNPGDEITDKEMTNTVKKLKRKKSTGPDKLPNEIFIEANKPTLKIYKELFNDIYTNEDIPSQWLIGEVIRLYKGKGTKGKCENERGITLASNVGKVFERIINGRAKPAVNITEAQAGGKEGAATADHLITLKETVKQIRKRNKTAYVIFLDVQKAYDKAWLDAIMYVMHKNGLKGKNWEITRKLNTNLRATIRTKYGNTRQIQIRDSIRQGGVLSVLQYATIIDEIAKELNQRQLGITIEGLGKLGCLLWMDDVALVHHDLKELQLMMDATNDIAQRYHIEFGAAKCKVVRIGPGKRSNIKLGNTTLEETDNYKYLGEILNKKASRKDHITAMKGKVNGAYNNITSWTGNKEFKSIRMKAIWKLVDMCIIPIMTYGAEAANHTKKEEEEIQQIFNNLLKRILDLPQSTPNLPLLIETGYLPMECYMDRKRIMQANRVKLSKDQSLIKRVTENSENEWMKTTKTIMAKYQISTEDLQKSKYTLKAELIKNQTKYFEEIVNREKPTKSKLKHLMDHKPKLHLGKRPKYMDELSRKQCRLIAMARTRMIPVKSNHKGSYKEQDCRWCKQIGTTETQEHILSECVAITKDQSEKIEYQEIFKDDDLRSLKDIADKLEATHTLITTETQETDKNDQPTGHQPAQ